MDDRNTRTRTRASSLRRSVAKRKTKQLGCRYHPRVDDEVQVSPRETRKIRCSGNVNVRAGSSCRDARQRDDNESVREE